jgi:ABC-type glycerol-3-phosphate transport system permease component
MFIACLVPIAGFLIFQRSFLRGSGMGGAIKG